MNEEIKAYQALLEQKMAENSTDIFSNYTKAHAECIIKSFLADAKEKVDILSGGLDGAFYDGEDMVQRFKDAANRGVAIRLISLGGVGQVGDIPQIQLRRGRVIDDSKGKVFHFMVADGRRYRLEEAHGVLQPLDPVHAEVCCNGVDKANRLTSIFNTVWDKLGK